MSDRFTILLGGELLKTDRLMAAVTGSRIIAADGGMRHAEALGVVPELWVGDFDSTDAALFERWADVPRQAFPREKDATDGQIGVETAIGLGARRLVLAGGLGGARTDHAMQHIVYTVHLAEKGLDVLLTSGEEEMTPLLAGVTEIDLPDGALFSILGLGDLTALSIENARYPLERRDVPFGPPMTICNVARGRVRLTLEAGRGVVLSRPYDFTGV
ncbi:thiamine diphosphokinase [Rhizobiaceae bacterium BDR2-2]|uniref:Thiamine diphosphokinase n=1 Tax=Ectorhizobium quercum TaxID=2965071 RepID=A0AAE3N2G6_9HYPH|nr:thiamine diphosphokinase [Ectorhizobium quercum]MCX8999349.1 thiamine diphosphokinase [Ectorhizobium quercum]